MLNGNHICWGVRGLNECFFFRSDLCSIQWVQFSAWVRQPGDLWYCNICYWSRWFCKLHLTLRKAYKTSVWCVYIRALWFWTFLEFHYGQAGSSVCYRNLEVWLYTGLWRSCWNPPRNYHRVWKIQQWLKKEDFSTFVDSFEINTPRQLFIQPCVTKTERYGYIWNYGGCVEPSHRTTIGCEKG